MTLEEFGQIKPGDIVYSEIIEYGVWFPCYVLTKSEKVAHVASAILVVQDDTTTDNEQKFLLRDAVTRSYEELRTALEMEGHVKRLYGHYFKDK